MHRGAPVSRLWGSGLLPASLLLLILGGAGLAFGPPQTSLETLKALNDAGLHEVPLEEVLWRENEFLRDETVADFQSSFERSSWPTEGVFDGLDPAAAAADVFHIGKPLFVNSLFDRDDPMPTSGRIDRWLTRMAERTLREWKIDDQQPDYRSWLEQVKLWYWRNALVEAGPVYLVPVLDRRGRCVVMEQNYGWEFTGSANQTTRPCENGDAYLSESDARRLLESAGYAPNQPLRALRPLGGNGYVVPENCMHRKIMEPGDAGVWTDGAFAVDVLHGTLSKVSPRLAENVNHVYPPAEPGEYLLQDERVWLTLHAPFELKPFSCPERVPHSPIEPAAIPAERPPLESRRTAFVPSKARLDAYPTDDFLAAFRKLTYGGPEVSEIAKILSDPTKKKLIAGLNPKASALDALEAGPVLRADSLIKLPEKPDDSLLAPELLTAAARGLQKVYAKWETELSAENARLQTWRRLLINHGPAYFVPLSDPETGRCLAILRVSALHEPLAGGYALAPCESDAPPLTNQEAGERLGRHAASRLRLVMPPRKPADRSPESCDPLYFNGPFWSDGQVAVHAFSGHAYRIEPDGVRLDDPPPPLFGTVAVTMDDEEVPFLHAYLPLSLRPLDCQPPK